MQIEINRIKLITATFSNNVQFQSQTYSDFWKLKKFMS